MSPDEALIPIRFAHFGAVLLLLGTVVFRRRMAAPEVATVLAGRLRGWERWAAAVALVSALGWLLAETALAADGWADAVDARTVLSVLTDTPFGNVWACRLVLGAVVAGLTWRKAGEGWALEAAAVGLAASLGWIGHGVMHTGVEGDLAAACLGVHVLCAGLWAGALPAVLICLWEAGNHYPLQAAAASLKRFSAAGHLAVAGAVASGLYMAHNILEAWSLDLSVPYQQLLAAKIAGVALMIGLALANGYGLLPRLTRDSAPGKRKLMATTGLEVGFALAVLALVADFGNLPPLG